MLLPTVDLGVRVVAYGALLLAVPLAFLLVFRLIDAVALEEFVQQYEEASPDAGRPTDARPTVTDDGVRCPRCGEHNEREFTFCRDCQARIGGHPAADG